MKSESKISVDQLRGAPLKLLATIQCGYMAQGLKEAADYAADLKDCDILEIRTFYSLKNYDDIGMIELRIMGRDK